MVKKYKEYIKESHLDIDPFGEEDWDDVSLSPILTLARRQGKPLDQITKLDCTNKQLNSLEGIEKLINVEELQCYDNQLTNINEVVNLTKLKSLGCGYNLLTDLNIGNLINLISLGCFNNQLTSLDGIEKLTNLQILSCFNNQFSEEYKQYLRYYCKINKIESRI